MSDQSNIQFLRRASLVVSEGGLFGPPNPNQRSLDLSEMRFSFYIRASDAESPNNAEITVYNLSRATVKRIAGEFGSVQVAVAYPGQKLGQIFVGTIRQLRTGRADNKTTYLKIFANDADIQYNYGILGQTLSAGSTPQERAAAAAKALGIPAPDFSDINLNGVNPAQLSRGKVMFGMARSLLRDEAKNLNATWSFQGNRLQIISMQGYRRNEVVVLNARTGLIGTPEQTDEGIKIKSLINPRYRVGGLVQLSNSELNTNDSEVAQFIKGGFGVPPYNQWSGINFAADTSADGRYRIYVAEHSGDTWGQEWYTDLTCLSLAPSTKKTTAKD